MSKSQFPEVPANKWPPKKETLLRKHYAAMPWPELMTLLCKTLAAIYNKAHNIGMVREAEVVKHDGQNFTIGQPRVVKSNPAPAPTVVPVRNSNSKGTYAGAELQPFSGRPGAMDAYALPSLVGGRRVPRDGRVEAA